MSWVAAIPEPPPLVNHTHTHSYLLDRPVGPVFLGGQYPGDGGRAEECEVADDTESGVEDGPPSACRDIDRHTDNEVYRHHQICTITPMATLSVSAYNQWVGGSTHTMCR